MLDALARNWWAMALRGLAAIIFGILAFLWPGITLLALTFLFGAYALVDGMFAMIAAAQRAGRKNHWWMLLVEGTVGIAAGIITFLLPGLTALGLVYLIAIWAIVTGALEIIMAISLRREIEGEWLMVLLGALSASFGLFIAMFPSLGALSLIWVIGSFAIAFGVVMLILAFQLRGRRQPRYPMSGAPHMAPSR
jgi:uncharacterized membrane protein HdeD (DUF308 family)